jgi:hypothetical protein
MTTADSEDYEVVQEEGGTPFARQYQARHPAYPGVVLIEILTDAPKMGARFTAFERELVTLSLVGHTCVLEAADLATMPDGTPVVVSPLPEGVGLARWLEDRRPLTVEDALDVLAGIAEALSLAHERGLSHGCVCAENVFLAVDEGGGIGAPKLHGFRQRRLITGKSDGDDFRADVRALARLAEQLLTPPELRTTGVNFLRAPGSGQVATGAGWLAPGGRRSFGTAPGVASVVAHARGDKGFASPHALVDALVIAVRADETPERAITIRSAPISRETAVVTEPGPREFSLARRRAPLVIGLLAGSALSLLAMFALRAPARSELVGVGAAPPAAVFAPIAVSAPTAVPTPNVVPTPVTAVATPNGARPGRAPLSDAPASMSATTPAPPSSPAAAPLAGRTRADGTLAAALTALREGAIALGNTSSSASSSNITSHAGRTPLRGVVWSDREHRLVPVDESGMPVAAPPGATPPSGQSPPSLTTPGSQQSAVR